MLACIQFSDKPKVNLITLAELLTLVFLALTASCSLIRPPLALFFSGLVVLVSISLLLGPNFFYWLSKFNSQGCMLKGGETLRARLLD